MRKEPPFYMRWFAYSLGIWPIPLMFFIDVVTKTVIGLFIVPFWVLYMPWLTHRLQNYFRRYPDLKLIDVLKMKKSELAPYR